MQYDAAIVGSGACGGWACMQLAQAGMKVLLLEAGSRVDMVKDFHHRWPYELPYHGSGQPGLLRKYFRGSTEYNYRIMIDDRENPYTTPADQPFRWSRSRVLGGRTLHWGRCSDRMSDLEFKAASRDGYGDDWPVSYRDISPYYDRVERYIGVSASPEGLPQFPDGVFLPPMGMNCAETIFDATCRKIGLPSTQRRVAQLTRMIYNRPPCHYCGNCVNGCDVGAMFNTIATTLPPAMKTGNVTVLCDSVVSHVLMNDENRARGVRYIERFTNKSVEVEAPVVILAGSSLENTRLLLNSAKGGLANSSGVLGHYVMDQISGAGVSGFLPILKGSAIRNDDGKAGGVYIPNFSNLGKKQGKFIRGYAMSASGGAAMFPAFAMNLPGYGSSFKKEVKRLYPAGARSGCREAKCSRAEKTSSSSTPKCATNGAFRFYASTARIAITTSAFTKTSSSMPKNYSLPEARSVRTWEKNPDIYSSGITDSIFVIMSRTFAPAADRLKSVIARERQIPAVFDAARANLKNPPRIYTEIAIEQLPGILSFFQNDVPAAFQQVTDQALLAEFKKYNDGAMDALKTYQSFLKDDLLPRSHGDFRIGADLFHKKLLYEEMVDIPLDHLLEIGMADLRRNQQAFKETAAKIDPAKTPQQILDDAARDHPAADHLLQSFRDVLEGLKDYIVAKHIITVPSPVLPIVEETPPFMRALTTASMDTPPFKDIPSCHAVFSRTFGLRTFE